MTEQRVSADRDEAVRVLAEAWHPATMGAGTTCVDSDNHRHTASALLDALDANPAARAVLARWLGAGDGLLYRGRVEAFDAVLAYVRQVNGNGHDEPNDPALDAVYDKVADLRSRATAALAVERSSTPEPGLPAEPPACERVHLDDIEATERWFDEHGWAAKSAATASTGLEELRALEDGFQNLAAAYGLDHERMRDNAGWWAVWWKIEAVRRALAADGGRE